MLDASRPECGRSFAIAELLAVDVAASRGREEERVYPDAAAALGVPRRRAGATARAFSGGRVPLEQAHRDRVLELTALVARKQPQRYGPFAALWLCLYLEAHEKATPEDVELLVSSLRALATPKDHVSALAILRKVIRP